MLTFRAVAGMPEPFRRYGEQMLQQEEKMPRARCNKVNLGPDREPELFENLEQRSC